MRSKTNSRCRLPRPRSPCEIVMRLAEICVKHPVFATMLTAFLVVIGIVSMRGLGVDLIRKSTFPRYHGHPTAAGLRAGRNGRAGKLNQSEECLTPSTAFRSFNPRPSKVWPGCFVTFVLERDVGTSGQTSAKKSPLCSPTCHRYPTPIVEKFDPDPRPSCRSPFRPVPAACVRLRNSPTSASSKARNG